MKNKEDLTEKLEMLENKHMENEESNTFKEILDPERIFKNLLENQEEKRAKLIQLFFLRTAQNPKKLLAWRIRKQQAERFIPKMRDPLSETVDHDLENMQNASGILSKCICSSSSS